jgi:hypothetical protein
MILFPLVAMGISCRIWGIVREEDQELGDGNRIVVVLPDTVQER